MSMARALQRQREREQEKIRNSTKTTRLPTIRSYPRDVIKVMKAERKREIRFYQLFNRVAFYDDWDLVIESEVG
jgi:hypothetical protein